MSPTSYGDQRAYRRLKVEVDQTWEISCWAGGGRRGGLTLTIGSVALEKSSDWSCDSDRLNTLPRWPSMTLRCSYVSRLYTWLLSVPSSAQLPHVDIPESRLPGCLRKCTGRKRRGRGWTCRASCDGRGLARGRRWAAGSGGWRPPFRRHAGGALPWNASARKHRELEKANDEGRRRAERASGRADLRLWG